MSGPTVLVTGATGHVGSEIVRQIAHRGAEVRAAVPPSELSRVELPEGIAPVAFDYDDADLVRRALAGVDRFYMMAPIEVRFTERMSRMIDAAAEAKVGRIVQQSQFSANVRPGMKGTIWHSEMEARTRACGAPFAILECNAFMQNVITRYAEDIRRRDAIVAPAGDSRVSFIDPADIGACAVELLLGEGHENKTFPVTGPQSLSFQDLADTLSRVLGRKITYVDQSDDAFRSAAKSSGMDDISIQLTLDGYAVERLGHYAEVTDAVQRLLGRPGRRFEDWARSRRSAFGLEHATDAA